jgi:hypothetical protein
MSTISIFVDMDVTSQQGSRNIFKTIYSQPLIMHFALKTILCLPFEIIKITQNLRNIYQSIFGQQRILLYG